MRKQSDVPTNGSGIEPWVIVWVGCRSLRCGRVAVLPMQARDFPSYRLRHAIRVWRYRRKHPWQFSQGEDVQPFVYDEGCAACASTRSTGKQARHHDQVVRLPESEDLDRDLHRLGPRRPTSLQRPV